MEVLFNMEAVALDSKTIIIKAENESDISEVISFISQKSKRENIDALLKFASQNRVIEKEYIFNRDNCYDE